MSPSVNLVHLIGRIGHEPDMRYLESGQCLTRFRLATDRPARAGAGGEAQEPHPPQPDWHQVVCWGQTAEFAGTYLATGRLVYVSGRLAYQTYEGRDGQRHRTVEVVAREVVPLDRPPQREAPDEDEAVPADTRTDAPEDMPESAPAPPAPFTPPRPAAANGGGPQAPTPLPHRSPSRARVAIGTRAHQPRRRAPPKGGRSSAAPQTARPYRGAPTWAPRARSATRPSREEVTRVQPQNPGPNHPHALPPRPRRGEAHDAAGGRGAGRAPRVAGLPGRPPSAPPLPPAGAPAAARRRRRWPARADRPGPKDRKEWPR